MILDKEISHLNIMENKDYVLRVKYSLIEKSDKGKNKILKKKARKSFHSGNTAEILQEINSIENILQNDDKKAVPARPGSPLSFIGNFLKRWKYAYYEMLSI